VKPRKSALVEQPLICCAWHCAEAASDAHRERATYTGAPPGRVLSFDELKLSDCCGKHCTHKLRAEQVTEIRKGFDESAAGSGGASGGSAQVARRKQLYRTSAVSGLCSRALGSILNLSLETVRKARAEAGEPAAHGLTGTESPQFDAETYAKVNVWMDVHTVHSPVAGPTRRCI
jgi:hypothetical protein